MAYKFEVSGGGGGAQIATFQARSSIPFHFSVRHQIHIWRHLTTVQAMLMSVIKGLSALYNIATNRPAAVRLGPDNLYFQW